MIHALGATVVECTAVNGHALVSQLMKHSVLVKWLIKQKANFHTCLRTDCMYVYMYTHDMCLRVTTTTTPVLSSSQATRQGLEE